MGRHGTKRRHRSPDSSGDERRRHDNRRSQTNLADFSFLNHKSELNRVLLGHSPREQLVENPADLWLFVQRYEALLKRSGNCVLPDVDGVELNKPPKGFPTQFKTIHLNNLRFAVPVEELLGRVSRSSALSGTKVAQFLQIVLQYLAFKQQEKFAKLKKLRVSQENLPVAKFRDEIVAAVQEKSVVLLAGDTGCGKSTQIPQYLQRAGFKSIG